MTKEIIMITARINKIEIFKNESKTWLFERLNKTNSQPSYQKKKTSKSMQLEMKEMKPQQTLLKSINSFRNRTVIKWTIQRKWNYSEMQMN